MAAVAAEALEAAVPLLSLPGEPTGAPSLSERRAWLAPPSRLSPPPSGAAPELATPSPHKRQRTTSCDELLRAAVKVMHEGATDAKGGVARSLLVSVSG